MTDQSESIGSYSLRSGLTIFPAQDAAFERVLNDLVQKVPARFALLTDTSGLLIGFKGERNKMDLVALGSLVASDLAASQAVADITGEHADYQLALRQGQSHNLLLVGAGRQLVLLVQAPTDVPVGWSRMLVLEAARQLQTILAMPPQPEEPLTLAPDSTENDLAETGLTDLFSQALDSMWSD
ncbi:hypothetical protein PLCT1_00231 [Planctomycetaceae bacterium]|nr:hypothetical protein PLCT1_00231 [Planctomycetaceae bacterium]